MDTYLHVYSKQGTQDVLVYMRDGNDLTYDPDFQSFPDLALFLYLLWVPEVQWEKNWKQPGSYTDSSIKCFLIWL